MGPTCQSLFIFEINKNLTDDLWRHADVRVTSAQDELADSIFESVDVVRARVRGRVRWNGTCMGSGLVVAPDPRVAGVADGDQKSAARRAVISTAMKTGSNGAIKGPMRILSSP